MKVRLLLCAVIVYCSGYSLTEYNYLCFARHGDYLKHPNDCQKFIRCSHGRAYGFQCPGNLWWHQKIKSCDYSYRTECKLNIGESSSAMDTVTVNVTEQNFKKLATDNIVEGSPIENFSKSNILELSTREHSLTTKAFTASNFTRNVLELLTPEITINVSEQFINGITTDNVTELSIKEDTVIISQESTKNVTSKSMLELTTDDNTVKIKESLFNISTEFNETELSTEKTTTPLTEQLLDDTTVVSFHSESSIEENITQLTEQLLNHATRDNVSEFTTEENTIQLTEKLYDNNAVDNVNYVPELSVDEITIQLTEQLFDDTTVNKVTYVPKFSTDENTIQLTKQLPNDTTMDNVNYVPELSTEKDAMKLTEKLLDDITVYNLDNILELSTEKNTTQLTNQLLNVTAVDHHRELSTEEMSDNVSKLPAQKATAISIPELSTAAATKTTESSAQPNFKENGADISRNLLDTTMTYATETSTEIVYPHAITNNKNNKKLFYKLSHQLLTSISMPTNSQRPPDSTTQDPRLPFRAIECQGENNRQQFKALKCYQYYQCFAGWAFLLNCHEGWWFHADMKRCIQDVDNECGY